MPEKQAEDRGESRSALHPEEVEIMTTFSVNALSPYFLITELWDLLAASPKAKVVNVSSGLGQLAEMGSGYAGYRISKTALNSVTRIMAAEGKYHNILVNSCCPGWVQTEMGGSGAPRSVQQGAETIVW